MDCRMDCAAVQPHRLGRLTDCHRADFRLHGQGERGRGDGGAQPYRAVQPADCRLHADILPDVHALCGCHRLHTA